MTSAGEHQAHDDDGGAGHLVEDRPGGPSGRWPMVLAVASRATNTSVKPATNSSVARSTRRCSVRVATASSLAPTPDISDR